jgi:hypothetical protein
LLLRKNWNNGRKKFCREWTLRLDYRVLHCSCWCVNDAAKE